MGFNDWNSVAAKIESDALFSGESYPFPGTLYGKWIPRSSNAHLNIYAGIKMEKMKSDKNANISVYAVLDDLQDNRTEKYEEEWNGMWQFFNVMQFDSRFVAVSQSGLDQMVYLALNAPTNAVTIPDYTEPVMDNWAEIISMLFDDKAKTDAEKLKLLGVKAPDEVGYEIADDIGEVLATIEMAWTDAKVAYLTEEQKADQDTIARLGWKIIEDIDNIDMAIFGGAHE